jgi:hypothetical protein
MFILVTDKKAIRLVADLVQQWLKQTSYRSRNKISTKNYKTNSRKH